MSDVDGYDDSSRQTNGGFDSDNGDGEDSWTSRRESPPPEEYRRDEEPERSPTESSRRDEAADESSSSASDSLPLIMVAEGDKGGFWGNFPFIALLFPSILGGGSSSSSTPTETPQQRRAAERRKEVAAKRERQARVQAEIDDMERARLTPKKQPVSIIKSTINITLGVLGVATVSAFALAYDPFDVAPVTLSVVQDPMNSATQTVAQIVKGPMVARSRAKHFCIEALNGCLFSTPISGTIVISRTPNSQGFYELKPTKFMAIQQTFLIEKDAVTWRGAPPARPSTPAATSSAPAVTAPAPSR